MTRPSGEWLAKRTRQKPTTDLLPKLRDTGEVLRQIQFPRMSREHASRRATCRPAPPRRPREEPPRQDRPLPARQRCETFPRNHVANTTHEKEGSEPLGQSGGSAEQRSGSGQQAAKSRGGRIAANKDVEPREYGSGRSRRRSIERPLSAVQNNLNRGEKDDRQLNETIANLITAC